MQVEVLKSSMQELGLAHLRKSESVSGHVPVVFICCEYHLIGNNEFLILDQLKFKPTCLVTVVSVS